MIKLLPTEPYEIILASDTSDPTRWLIKPMTAEELSKFREDFADIVKGSPDKKPHRLKGLLDMVCAEIRNWNPKGEKGKGETLKPDTQSKFKGFDVKIVGFIPAEILQELFVQILDLVNMGGSK